MRLGRICKYTDADFDLVKSNGLEFLEICCNWHQEAIDCANAVKSIQANVDRTGIAVSSVGRWNHELFGEGKCDQEKLDTYYGLLDAAMALGAKSFVCGCNYDESISLFRNYENAVKFFGDLVNRAKGSGTKIAVQNCQWNNFVVSPAQWEIVLGHIPELMIKFDASHAYNRGDDYLAELSDWGERVAHVHIKGTVHAGKREVDDPPAGMDDIKWRSLFAILYARGYDGDLSIEPHSATWKGERGSKGVEFTANFIRQFMM